MNIKIVTLVATLLCCFKVFAEPIKIPRLDERSMERLVKFHSFTGRDIKGFIATKPELQEVAKVFYPFGGADIIYPLTIFPKAMEITLAGLEDIGPKPTNLELEAESITLGDDVASLLKRSFFVTRDMGQNFASKHVGTMRRILEQLSSLGVSEADLEVFDRSNQKLAITFTYNNIKRRVSYFKKNFLDQEKTAAFLNDLKEKDMVQGTLLKATSYTLHRPEFVHIKDFIVKSTSLIVEDDSGVPLRDLKDFEVQKFGQYKKPYGVEFSCYTQKDLAQKPAIDDQKLGFCFGYGCGRQPSSLIIAKRKVE
jgi:hypothetical protein